MQKRKYAILAAAALGAAPVLTHAAISVVYSYDASTIQISAASTFAAAGLSTIAIVGNAVSVPSGDYFRFGVDVSVTGDANAAAGQAFDTNNSEAQPNPLGLASFGFAFNDSSPSALAPFANAAGTSRATFNAGFGTTGAGNVNASNGQVGTGGFFLSGGNNVNVTDGNGKSALLSIGATAPAQLFKNVIYKAGTSGSSVITPVLAAGTPTIAILDPAYANTASQTAAPDYIPTGVGFTTTNLPALTVNVTGGVTTSAGGSNKIISLVTSGVAPTGTQPNGYGANPLGTITVSNAGGSGKYFPGYFNIAGGATSGFIAVKGFLPADSPEIFALQVNVNGATPSASALAAIIADINSNNSGVTASTIPASLAGIFSGYQVELTGGAGGASPFFAFDFSSSGSDTTDGDSALGPVTVTSIAAVPEPATAAGIILGSAGLLLGRRKKQTAIA